MRRQHSPWPALLAVGLGASVAPFDFAVNVAFPAITDAFALPTPAIRWVAVCYVLTYGSLMLGFGALGDRIGHLRVFRAGLALSAAAFALCALAPSYPWFLAARVVQGVAAALLLSCTTALAVGLVEPARRTWALGAFNATQAVAVVLAPVAGGLALAALGWPGVYWFRVPIALVALAVLPWVAHASWQTPPAPASAPDRGASALLAGAVALLLLGPSLLGSGEHGAAAAAAVAGALLATAFVARQRRSTAPFLPHAVARDGVFARINAAAMVVQFACFAVPLIVPYYLLRGGGWTPQATGLLLCAWAVGSLAASALAARAAAAWGARRAAFAGAALATAGLVAIAAWPAQPHAPWMVASLLLQGAGLGLFQVAYTDVVVAALPAASRGVAGSLALVTRTVGLVLGATAWFWLLQAGEARALDAGAAGHAAFMQGFALVYAVAAAVTAATFAVTAAWRGTWGGAHRG